MDYDVALCDHLCIKLLQYYSFNPFITFQTHRDSAHIHLLIAQFIESSYASNLRPFYPM